MVDLDKLGTYLTSEEAPENSMLLSDLDGFLTGILCSPDLIPPSEWLPVVWRNEDFKAVDINKHMWATEAIVERYNEIASCLNSEPPYLEPIFWQAKEGHVIAMDWCEGFMDAVAMRKAEWDAFMATKRGKDWMKPIVDHLFDENFEPLSGVNERQLDAHLDCAAKKIPQTVPRIFAYWQAKRAKTTLH